MKPVRFSSPRFFTPLVSVLLLALLGTDAQAKNGRQFKIPNGTVNSCSNCHINPAGGGPRTPFGEDVFAAMGSIPRAASFDFWDAELATTDSDNDGFTNGEELGDPDGDLLNLGPAGAVSNPGVASSTPPQPNNAPAFQSSPNTTAHIGEEYSYQATGFDFDGHALTFSKVTGPVWLNVSGSGLVSGTPPEGSAGDIPVSLRVTDNGTPNLSSDQNYTLSISASFAGFQNLNFALPEEAAIAAPDQDADLDGVSNFVEYARKTDPRSGDDVPPPTPLEFDASGHMQFVLQVRDDDPDLIIQLEASDVLPFGSGIFIAPDVTDPNESDGVETWTFTDTASKDTVMKRFGRLKYELSQ